MLIEIKVPELSESVQSGTLLDWRKAVGEAVARDETIADLETDKVILEVTATAAGVLRERRVEAGGEVRVGDVLAVIATEGEADALPAPALAVPPPSPTPTPTPTPTPSGGAGEVPSSERGQAMLATPPSPPPSADIPASGGQSRPPECPPCPPCEASHRQVRRVPMSRLRLRIAERLLEAQRNAAILTTFNEIDMQPVQELRKRYQERFLKEHGVKLGLMSFFVKAVCQGLKAYPVVNARVEGNDIVQHDYYDIGIAVSSDRGLVVPVLKDADRLGFAGIERAIADFARRADSLELTLDELEGGTFTISNGGVFGSLLSTPILNPPQSGVLGLHRIQERPVALAGQVVIRPMMYVALSYDHRIIDGREAVSFLKSVKDALEDPASLLLEL